MTAKRTYPIRNYAVGQALLALRSRAQLTQAELASHLGLHRRSVQKWETGESYPRAEHLRALLTLFVARRVLTPDQEPFAAATLWEQVRQAAPPNFPVFDAHWFALLLAAHRAPPADEPAPATRADTPLASLSLTTVTPVPATPPLLLGRSAELALIAHRLGHHIQVFREDTAIRRFLGGGRDFGA